jgi:hypothetical protein
MKRKTIRILKYACLAIYLLIGIDVIVFGIKHGVPLVPIDPDGHTDPYYEIPGSAGW